LDLKPDNLSILNDGKVVTFDFGLSSYQVDLVSGGCGTDEYLPMEVRQSADLQSIGMVSHYDPKKVDVFNLGVILFLLAFG